MGGESYGMGWGVVVGVMMKKDYYFIYGGLNKVL